MSPDGLHDIRQAALEAEMIVLDELLDRDQIAVGSEELDLVEVGEPDMQLFMVSSSVPAKALFFVMSRA